MDLRSNVKSETPLELIHSHSNKYDVSDPHAPGSQGELRKRHMKEKPRVGSLCSNNITLQTMFATSLCCTTMRLWWRSKFARFEEFLHMHQWKVLSTVLLLVLFCLGLKMVAVDTDFDKLWVEGKSSGAVIFTCYTCIPLDETVNETFYEVTVDFHLLSIIAFVSVLIFCLLSCLAFVYYDIVTNFSCIPNFKRAVCLLLIFN